MNKSKVRQAIIQALRQEFASRLQSSKSTRATGNDAASKAEGKYDTRSTEENYLADGLAKQAQAALDAAAAFKALDDRVLSADGQVEMDALVELEFPDEHAWFYLGPAGGGTEVTVAKTTGTVLTAESPLGRQLLGRRVGESNSTPKTTIRTVK